MTHNTSRILIIAALLGGLALGLGVLPVAQAVPLTLLPPSPPEPTYLTLMPDQATNLLPTDTSEQFTAVVLSQYLGAMQGVLVSFSTDFGQFGGVQYVEVLTDVLGQATVTIVSNTAGTAHIRAWLDDGDDTYESGELTDDPSTKIWQEAGQLDFGDAPDSYGTLLASNGARHTITGCNLGSAVDGESDAQAPLDASGDDVNALDDEDGVTLQPILVPGIMAAVVVNGGPSGGLLDAWIDFDGNGVFDHPGEHLFAGTSQALTPGVNLPLSFQVPPGATAGTTYARFRLSMLGGLSPTGLAPDGEVEDYVVEIQQLPGGTGTVVLRKETDPPGGTDFDFINDFGIGIPGFSLDDGATLTIPYVPAGTYGITETLPIGWELTGLDCETDDLDDTSSWSGNSLTIDLDAGETITCTFNNAALGTIVLQKETDPPGGMDFDFLDDFGIGIPEFSLDDGATLTIPYVPAGTYGITETLPIGWELTGLDCETDDLDDTSSWSGNSLTIDLDAGETITCTFNNAALGTIVLRKEIYPPLDISFDFLNDFGIGLPDFTLSGDTPLTIPYVPAGTYSVTEVDPVSLGFDLIGLTCEDPDGGSSIDLDARTATIDLDAGETITCTFSNSAQPGSITVVKQVVGDAPATDWSFSGDLGSFTLPAAGGQKVFTEKAAGDYIITETTKDGYAASVVCDSGESGSNSVTVNLAPGEDVTCTFTNTTQPGSITVVKQVVGDAPADAWSFSGDLGSFTLPAAGGQQVFSDKAAGDYTITETSKDGYAASVVCDSGESGSNSVTVNLAPGEDVTCTFTNTAQPGKIIVEKQTDPDGATDTFTFSGDAAGSIKDGEQIVVGDLLPGTYTSQETVPAGWELTAITCDDGNSTGDVGTGKATFNLEANETVQCTFSNKLKRGTIIVEKQTEPDGAAGSFTFSGDAAGTLSDGGTIVVSDLAPGVYISTEADPGPDFELAAITCDDGNSTGDVGTRTATFVLDPDETVKCTFNNARRSLQVDKATLWPVNGLAGLSQEIRYLITIENTGGLAVDPLMLRDEYDPWCLTSRKAQTPPDLHGGTAGFLQWNDLGTLAPGETTSLWVEFVASRACDPATNTAIVATGGLTFQDEATLRILETIAFIRGRVFHDETGAGAHLGSYRGVEGAQVSMDSLLYTTNTSGWYSFNLLDPGAYTVLSAASAGSWWTPITSETCAATIVNKWDQVFCNFGYWWGLDGPPLDGLAAQQQVTLTPLQDTAISGLEPGNHGFAENVWVRQPGQSSTLVKFDLSGLPEGAQIVWARLRLYAATASNPDNRLYGTAYAVSKMWVEGEATWSEAAAGLPWEEAGAIGAGDHSDPVGWAWTNTLGWVEFDLDPALVAAWLADGGSNHGLLLRGEGSENRRVAYRFLSQEHGNAAAHPQLVVGYNLP